MHDYTPPADLAHAVDALLGELSPAARPFLAALLHAFGPEDDDGEPTPSTRWAGGAFDPGRVDEIHKALVAMVETTDHLSPAGLIEHARQRARLTVAGLEHEALAALAAFVALRPLLADRSAMH